MRRYPWTDNTKNDPNNTRTSLGSQKEDSTRGDPDNTNVSLRLRPQDPTQRRSLRADIARRLKDPDLIPDVIWNASCNRWEVIPRRAGETQCNDHTATKPTRIIFNTGYSIRNRKECECSACAKVPDRGQCLYCSNSPDGHLEHTSGQIEGTSRYSEEDCPTCHYVASGVEPCLRQARMSYFLPLPDA